MADTTPSFRDTFRQAGRTLARFVGLVFALLGTWVLVVNLIEIRYSGWILAWVIVAGLLGGSGGVLFLLSYDGPRRMRTRRNRLTGWLGMLAFALLPSSLSPILLLMALFTIPTLSRRAAE